MISNAPIDLKSYFFPFVRVAADPECNPDQLEFSSEIEVKSSVEHDDNNGVYQVTLSISVLPETEDAKLPYSIELVAVGLFSVSEKIEDPVRMLKINGSSILYSAAREFIITITSRGPWPQFVLPTASFYYPKSDPSNEKAKQHKLAGNA